MGFTVDDVTRLKEAIGTGLLQVRYADGRQVTYRSLAEMRQILTMMQGDIAGAAGQAGRTSVAGF